MTKINNKASERGSNPTITMPIYALILSSLLFVFIFTGCTQVEPQKEQVFDPGQIAPFVEPNFPFITTAVDARKLGRGLPQGNLIPRCLALRLGEQAYACFDTDLLRWSVAWTGDFLPMVAMPMISYRDFHNKKNGMPAIAGEAMLATGMYPGWSSPKSLFTDPRPASPNPKAPPWGPIPQETGRWNGVYTHGRDVVLDYTVQNTEIIEKPGVVTSRGQTAFTRTFRINSSEQALSLVASEVTNGVRNEKTDSTAYIFQGAGEDTVTAIGVKGNRAGINLEIMNEQYATVHVSPGEGQRQFTLVMWSGPADQLSSFQQLVTAADSIIPNFREGGPAYWDDTVHTRGQLSPDTSAYVTDLLTLPSPNPWKRNVRAVDISFFNGNRAAVVTFEGDVWIVEGVSRDLEHLRWHRYASGLHEPQSIEVVEDQIYVYGREGIVRFHDLNDDGVADYYENFSNLMAQSMETREWPTDMVHTPVGGFYVAKGGAGDAGPQMIPSDYMNGFRYGSRHSGTILKISADGRSIHQYASGFRVPYLGINPANGVLSASDQQGHFVPSTPILMVNEGDYFGVPATAHIEKVPEINPPLLWLPHSVDRSGAGQVWINSGQMGPLNNRMVHLSLGRPGLFKVMIDSTGGTIQGAASFIKGHYPAPTIKGEVNPGDGQLYAAGFDLWGSNADELSAVLRLRYTGLQSYLPVDFKVLDKGIVMRFGKSLDSTTATDPVNYQVKRWNYKRTENYGSGHYKLDGSPGEELLPVFSSHLSRDGRSVFLAVPNMQEAMQMEVTYQFKTEGGTTISDKLWLTAKDVASESDLLAERFPDLEADNLNLDISSLDLAQTKYGGEVSVERGQKLFQQTGCIGCHSLDGINQGYYGPTMKGLFGTERILSDSSTVEADEAYVRESILHPENKVVQGYGQEMPTFQGILSENEVQSIIKYIETL